jgi:hypothetical protein
MKHIGETSVRPFVKDPNVWKKNTMTPGCALVKAIWPSLQKKMGTNKGEIIDIKEFPEEVWPTFEEYKAFPKFVWGQPKRNPFNQRLSRRLAGIKTALRGKTGDQRRHKPRFDYIGDGKVCIWWKCRKTLGKTWKEEAHVFHKRGIRRKRLKLPKHEFPETPQV